MPDPDDSSIPVTPEEDEYANSSLHATLARARGDAAAKTALEQRQELERLHRAYRDTGRTPTPHVALTPEELQRLKEADHPLEVQPFNEAGTFDLGNTEEQPSATQERGGHALPRALERGDAPSCGTCIYAEAGTVGALLDSLYCLRRQPARNNTGYVRPGSVCGEGAWHVRESGGYDVCNFAEVMLLLRQSRS